MIRTPTPTSDQRQAAETGQQKGQFAIDLALRDDPLAAFGIDLGKRFQILVEGGTHRAIGVVVAPFAAGGGTDLDAAANQFLAEVDELFDALLEHRELLGIVGLDDGLPVFHHGQDLVVEFEQPLAILLHDRCFRRHVDAAGFHHDGIDQRIDALDVERGAAGGLDGFREFDVPAGVIVGQGGDSRGQQREQREDRVQLGGKRQPGRNAMSRKRGRGISRFQALHGLSRRRPVNIVGRLKIM